MYLLKQFQFDNTFSPENIPDIFVNRKHFSELVSAALSCGVGETLGQE